MKILALMILGLGVVGCGETYRPPMPPEKPDTSTSTNSPPKPTDQNSTKLTPTKELSLREKVIGEYEIKVDEGTERIVLLENGVARAYTNGKKREDERKWKITKEGKIHVEDKYGERFVWRINKDESITGIATIDKDGKREDLPKKYQLPFIKIK